MPERELTQIERIIVKMMQNPAKMWWVAQDFMPPAIEKGDPLHVGYEATARISDMVTRYCTEDNKTAVFDTKRIEKFRAVRLKFEVLHAILEEWPELIELAKATDIMRIYHLNPDSYHYEAKPAKPSKFKSYAV